MNTLQELMNKWEFPFEWNDVEFWITLHEGTYQKVIQIELKTGDEYQVDAWQDANRKWQDAYISKLEQKRMKPR